MKIYTFEYFFSYTMKRLKRNITTTIFSVIIISITFFILGLFYMYIITVNKNSVAIFPDNRELMKVLGWLKTAAFVILPPTSILLIVNSFKMTTFFRESEISIMKSMGATDWFIRWPFIIEGVVIGVIGTYIGYLALFYMYSFIYNNSIKLFEELSFVQPVFITDMMLWKFLILGLIIGIISNIIVLRKSLNCRISE